MISVRLKSETLTLKNGESFEICCSMAVLADIEEEFGSIDAALTSGASWRAAIKILTFMVNAAGAAKDSDFSKFTPEKLGALLPDIRAVDAFDLILELVMDAMGTELVGSEDSEKN